MAAMLIGLFLLAGAPGVLAHDGHDHTIMGTVTMAAPDHVMMKDTEGKDLTVLVTRETKVTRNKEPMRVQDIQAGTRIVVTAVTENNRTTAKDIQVALNRRPASLGDAGDIPHHARVISAS
jgi:hypothetical protein